MRKLVYIILLALCLPAQAEQVTIGIGPYCDTKEQMERYVTLFTGDAVQTVALVNAENSPTSCEVGHVVYVKGEDVGKARGAKFAATISAITIIGVVTPHGVRPATPLPQFTAFLVKEVEA